MTASRSRRRVALLLTWMAAVAGTAHAQSFVNAPSAIEAPSIVEAPSAMEEQRDRHSRLHRHHGHGNDRVSIGHDSVLLAAERADSVVSVFGNTRVSGPLTGNAVAVLGNTYVDSAIDGDAVAVLGNLELGPHADIGGDAVAVGGTLLRDPAAIVHGQLKSIGGRAAGFDRLQPWFANCLIYGRPLAVVSGIGWAWGLAVASLAVYAALALLFRSGINHCVHTLETQPGMTVLAALLTLLLSPILLVLLCITVIGIASVPFVILGLFCAGLFGKAVMLAWLGRRCMGAPATGPYSHPASAVLVGGVIVLALYLVPVIGLTVYLLSGLAGLGAVVYTLILAAQQRRIAKDGHQPSAASPSIATPPGTQAPAAAPMPSAASTTTAPSTPAAAPAPVISAALPRAGFWIRMAALLIDMLLIGFLMGVLHRMLNLELVVLAAYGAVMWKLRGSTIGGIVFDLRVVRLDGQNIDWATAIVRALGCFLSLAVGGLGFFWIAFDEAKQAWHDKIAGTVVVRVEKGVALL